MEQYEYTGKKVIYWPIKWDKFKTKYKVWPGNLDEFLKCKTFEDKEKYLKNYYETRCHHLSTSDLSKLTESDLKYYKEYEKKYIEKVLEEKSLTKSVDFYIYHQYIDFCHLKEAFEYLESDFGHNMEETIKINTKKEDKEFNDAVKQHQRYKFWYYFGLIAWMTSCFWAPFLIGIINFAIDNINSALPMDNLWVGGIAYVLAFSFTMPVTIPLSFLIGAFVHPKILKSMIFTKDKPYCENLMKELNHSTKQENLNSASIVAGTLLEKYLK